MDHTDLILVFFAFAAGGVIKGATGAGAPLLAVPLMVMLRDVQFAVAVFVLPNIVPNIWQGWAYRRHVTERGFALSFAIAGGLGTALGTVALAGWKPDALMLTVAGALILYIGFRLARPSWQMPFSAARKSAFPMGLLAGALQGASGLSAPVSLSFLNATGLERGAFVGTVSLFFIALGLGQLPVQIFYGIMTQERFLYSLLSLIPLFLFLPVGAWIGRRVSRTTFDRLILALLAVLAVKLLADVLA